MFDWIVHNKGLFLTSYTEIGTKHQHVLELQTQHNHFAMNCMVNASASFSLFSCFALSLVLKTSTSHCHLSKTVASTQVPHHISWVFSHRAIVLYLLRMYCSISLFDSISFVQHIYCCIGEKSCRKGWCFL